MTPAPLKRLRTLLCCLGVVALYALTPAMQFFERLYGGGPRRAGGAGLLAKGRPRLIGAFVALALYELTRALLLGRG